MAHYIDDCSTKEEVLAAVRIDGSKLEFANESFKKDPEVVLAALENDTDPLEYVIPHVDSTLIELMRWAHILGPEL